MRLFIIGNGFDKAHGLPTSYIDFRNYLENQDWEYLIRFEELYGFVPDSQREYVEDYLWKEFESQLSAIDDTQLIEYGTNLILGLEIEDTGVKDTLDIHWEEHLGFIQRLNDYIRLWIEHIDIRVPKKTSIIVADNDDLFISFNYTMLLEDLYNIDEYNILHIHSSIGEDDPLVIGHGNTDKINEARILANQADEEMHEKASSIHNAVAKFYERTLKDVPFLIHMYSSFFGRLRNANQIYIVGHSFGDVDIPYFRAVKENVKPDCIWNVYYHDPKDEIIFKEKLIAIGVEEKNIRMEHSIGFFK